MEQEWQERENSVFILTCPWGEYERLERMREPYKIIRKHVLMSLVRQFWNICETEPFVVSPEDDFANFCNLFIQTRDCNDIYDTISISSQCWQGNITYLLGHFKYAKTTIKNLLNVGENTIVFHIGNINDHQEVIGFTAHKSVRQAIESVGIVLAADDYPDRYCLNAIYDAFKSRQEMLYEKHKITLLVRKAYIALV
jgi:hypothetical protein